MFNTKFNTIAEACKLNNLTETAAASMLKRFMENGNYREGYNHRRSELMQALKNDPVVQERAAALAKKRA